MRAKCAHGIEEGAVEIHDLGVEAFDEFSDGLGVVADGSGEDERGAMGGGNGELVLGVVGDFLVFAFGRGHIEVTAEKHGGGAGDERAGNVAGRTGSAVELRGGIPSPIVSCALEHGVELGTVGEWCGFGVAVADSVTEFGDRYGVGSGEGGLGKLQGVAGRHVARVEFQACGKGSAGESSGQAEEPGVFEGRKMARGTPGRARSQERGPGQAAGGHSRVCRPVRRCGGPSQRCRVHRRRR